MPAKPFLHPLKTPKTATFPSELHDDINTAKTPSTISDTIKYEPGTATPITPPTAYTEFLKALTPVFTSPVSAGTSFPRFQFDKPAGPAGQGPAQGPTSAPTPTSTTTSQPASAVSGTFGFHEREPPVKSATLPPPPATATGTGPYSGPGGIRKHQSLRRLRIPPSMHLSPITTAASDAPRSATTLRSPFSPGDWKLRYMEPRSATTTTSTGGGGRSVSVRQVVTRTVTYKRMQLEAPPKGKGKRRRYHEGKDV
ncbi:uncharacterized protein ACHE_10687S [Aspergillus chevalieri]|uniref:Uncharacterized protein n=1 Tax=Aspergillus chevalieri TaxID=182096 RepID=A0A7R7ZI44_ASPCH|nr:uncharacterized protein ACHE_10687S [Aspergillus chevalieri]BCR83285.1 hypothetical protein ACHE_10687S [Aspergillus chevalieri]